MHRVIVVLDQVWASKLENCNAMSYSLDNTLFRLTISKHVLTLVAKIQQKCCHLLERFKT